MKCRFLELLIFAVVVAFKGVFFLILLEHTVGCFDHCIGFVDRNGDIFPDVVINFSNVGSQALDIRRSNVSFLIAIDQSKRMLSEINRTVILVR